MISLYSSVYLGKGETELQPTPPPLEPPAGSWPPPPPAAKPPPSLKAFFAKLQGDSSGFLYLLVVLAAGVLLAYLLWVPLAQPALLVNEVVGEKNCANKLPGTNEMRTCAAGAAAWKMIGPVTVGVVVFLLRKRLVTLVSKLSAKMDPGGRPLVAPLLATLLFLLVWAGAHSKTAGQTGVLPQKAFPALIGLYTFSVVRYGPALRGKLAAFFSKRDRLPMFVRVILTIGIPTGISLLITNQERVSGTARKEQFVVLIGLVLAYLMLSPRGGEMPGAQKLVGVPAPRSAVEQ